MGYRFQIKGYYRVKVQKEYPWPCKTDPNRTMELFTDDVLTKNENGTYSKHTGLGTFNHVLADDEVEFTDKTARLQLLG